MTDVRFLTDLINDALLYIHGRAFPNPVPKYISMILKWKDS